MKNLIFLGFIFVILFVSCSKRAMRDNLYQDLHSGGVYNRTPKTHNINEFAYNNKQISVYYGDILDIEISGVSGSQNNIVNNNKFQLLSRTVNVPDSIIGSYTENIKIRIYGGQIFTVNTVGNNFSKSFNLYINCIF